jgi:hypothetical protein
MKNSKIFNILENTYETATLFVTKIIMLILQEKNITLALLQVIRFKVIIQAPIMHKVNIRLQKFTILLIYIQEYLTVLSLQ